MWHFKLCAFYLSLIKLYQSATPLLEKMINVNPGDSADRQDYNLGR